MARSENAVVAVVCGGTSAEAGVSRVSGRGVADALAATYRHVVTLEFDNAIADALREARPDVVFPVLHGPPGEDGTFQGFLETLGLPYVGSGVQASAFAMNKAVAKALFARAGLPLARDVVIRRGDATPAALDDVLVRLAPRVVVKPASQGSAVGVRFANTTAELAAAVRAAHEFDDAALIEERIDGREITVAILDRRGTEALPVVEVRTPAGTWYDFEHRYTQGLSEHVIPAPLPPAQYERAQEVAREAHRALGCRDLSRVDFVAPPDGEPVLLEVNTIPGMTPTSLYPDAARAAGLPFERLVAHLVERALERAA